MAELYVDLAEVWRNMTKKALWGNHAYNKMDCDKKVIYYYEKALQTDPSYQKARTTLARLKAPKPPVPDAVKKLEPIPDQYWDEAQSAMQMVDQGELIQPLEEKGNFINVADVFINTDGKGRVWLRRSGTEDWAQITSSPVVIYPFDAIKTSDEASGVSVTFASDKARLNIKSGSIVQFDDNYLYIQRGDVYVQVRKEGEKFFVVTPSAGHGVRGTEFEVSVAPDKSTTTYLYSGLVEVRNQTNISYLTAGEKLVAKAGEEVMQRSAFNASQRKAANWEKLIREAETQQLPYKPPAGYDTPDKTRQPEPAMNAVWGSYSLNDQNVGTLIDRELSSGKTPVGLQVRGMDMQILYLDQDLFKMTAWAIDWYANADEIKNGITTKMQKEDYFPMGISSDNKNLYVLYIKGETNPIAWQLVESGQNLQEVAADIQH
ncbi:MAG: FecR family protein [Bacteroidales bacterium]|nr:FecR family protein [Bacteroidales bacterium]MCF8343672.1 FecR family protein [Bacteroidales bacterium]MCF8346296.1 FecR family protein [Bacteroidales bacterium]MCF8375163.1 FecR family protein [Bacteroidales bacterium]MCF8401863.1 FecR family protein [Bacteroidales bacterium]